MGERFTVIAVDASVSAVSDSAVFDVLFVGTTSGRVLKLYHVDRPSHASSEHATNRFDRFLERDGGRPDSRPVLVESIQALPYDTPVRNLIVVGRRLVVLSDHEVKSLPLHRCASPAAQSCADCVALQDPYCAWDLRSGVCKAHHEPSEEDSDFVQDLTVGRHSACPFETPFLYSNSGKPPKRIKDLQK